MRKEQFDEFLRSYIEENEQMPEAIDAWKARDAEISALQEKVKELKDAINNFKRICHDDEDCYLSEDAAKVIDKALS